MTRIEIKEDDILLYTEPSSNMSRYNMTLACGWNKREQLKAQILSDAEKAQRLDESIDKTSQALAEYEPNIEWSKPISRYEAVVSMLKKLQQIRDGKT